MILIIGKQAVLKTITHQVILIGLKQIQNQQKNSVMNARENK